MRNKHRLQFVVFIVFLLLAQWIAMAPMALAQTPFYQGKNLLLLSGTDAGGAGDLRTRAVIPVLPPGTPAEQVTILREAMRKAFADPDYVKAYEKLTSEPAMPITWEEFEAQLREVPREAEIIDLFKRLSGPAPLPARPAR